MKEKEKHKKGMYDWDNSIQKPPFLPETRDFQISSCGNPVSTSRTPDSPPCKKEKEKDHIQWLYITKIGHGPKWLFKNF